MSTAAATGELELLRRRIAELEQQLAERTLSDSYAPFFERALAMLCIASFDGYFIKLNPAWEQTLGYSNDELLALPFLEFVHPDDREATISAATQLSDAGSNVIAFENRYRHKDGSFRHLRWSSTPIRDTGMIYAVVQDVSELREAEEALRQRTEAFVERERVEEALRQSTLQEEIIRAQAAALAELSTPLIPLNQDVVVMPLIGSVDSKRAQQVMETLLSGIESSHAEVAILDITGVSVVDTQVANVFIRAAQAVKLLGAQVMLTGIRPEVAQTLVGLGVDLSGIVTSSSLESGIAMALSRRRGK